MALVQREHVPIHLPKNAPFVIVRVDATWKVKENNNTTEILRKENTCCWLSSLKKIGSAEIPSDSFV